MKGWRSRWNRDRVRPRALRKAGDCVWENPGGNTGFPPPEVPGAPGVFTEGFVLVRLVGVRAVDVPYSGDA